VLVYKLNVLKWIEKKGLSIWGCALQAARHDQLHILKWLREEKSLKLYGYLYKEAIEYGDHLQILKWLREKEVSWDYRCYKYMQQIKETCTFSSGFMMKAVLGMADFL